MTSAAGILLTALLTFSACSGDEPPAAPEALPSVAEEAPPAVCPLTGLDPASGVDTAQAAIAVKIENNPVAYPLSGLQDADIVYEEEVEGGATRFMAIYHCTDTKKAGPVRSARTVDPAIMSPITRLLAAAGGNTIVLKALKKGDISLISEVTAGKAMRRIDRPGIASEHTLYGDTAALRTKGTKDFSEPPPNDIFKFGEVQDSAKKARSVTINFSGSRPIEYRWKGGGWTRYEAGEPFVVEGGKTIKVDNVLVESHTINYADGIVDIAGNKSVEIADVTGSGPAVLFRDGQAIVGRWTRESRESRAVFETKSGDEMVLKAGTTWVELVPNQKGEVKGSYSFK